MIHHSGPEIRQNIYYGHLPLLSMFIYGAALSMGNSENNISSILAYNSGLEQGMKFKLSPLTFLSLKITLYTFHVLLYAILVGNL